MKWIRQVLLKIQSGHDSADGRTDGRTDGQCDTSIPLFQLRWSGGLTSNLHFISSITHSQQVSGNNASTSAISTLCKCVSICCNYNEICKPHDINWLGTVESHTIWSFLYIIKTQILFHYRDVINIADYSKLQNSWTFFWPLFWLYSLMMKSSQHNMLCMRRECWECFSLQLTSKKTAS